MVSRDIDYWALRDIVKNIIPRMTQLELSKHHVDAVQEKGRKKGYHQFDIEDKEWKSQERLLDTEEVHSFLEVSVRAQACPMPLNLDIWDGLICPFRCKYCYANAFRASLYTAFFDNSKTMGFRHCDPDYYKGELDKLMALRGKDPHSISGDLKRSVAMEIPIRFGIRFEDFIPQEGEAKISWELLRYLRDQSYPLMINTKSDLVAREDYLEVLSSNEAGAAVHVTIISSDNELLEALEPGAPSYEARLETCRKLAQAGVRPVARIEPYLVFLTDDPEQVKKYMEDAWEAGVRHITFDTYSYTAHNPGIRQAFVNAGYDFERLFLLGCDSQGIGSLLLDKFMDLFRDYGFSCSSFDMGCTPGNDQTICCEVGDFFEDYGFNWGSTVGASRLVKDMYEEKGLSCAVCWKDFENYVNEKGAFISPALKDAVKRLWNYEGQVAYSQGWAAGLVPVGRDEDGLIWTYRPQEDFRYEILEGCL